MTEATTEEPESAEPDVTPLLAPAGGVPDLSMSASEIAAAAATVTVVPPPIVSPLRRMMPLSAVAAVSPLNISFG